RRVLFRSAIPPPLCPLMSLSLHPCCLSLFLLRHLSDSLFFLLFISPSPTLPLSFHFLSLSRHITPSVLASVSPSPSLSLPPSLPPLSLSLCLSLPLSIPLYLPLSLSP